MYELRKRLQKKAISLVRADNPACRIIVFLCRYCYNKISPQEMQVIEKGTYSRGNVYFVHPREMDENGFYILKGKESIIEELEQKGFTVKREGFYTIGYKE